MWIKSVLWWLKTSKDIFKVFLLVWWPSTLAFFFISISTSLRGKYALDLLCLIDILLHIHHRDFIRYYSMFVRTAKGIVSKYQIYQSFNMLLCNVALFSFIQKDQLIKHNTTIMYIIFIMLTLPQMQSHLHFLCWWFCFISKLLSRKSIILHL